MTRTYKLTERVWLWPGEAAWHFVTLPQTAALDIDDFFSHQKRGFGSLPVTVTIGMTTWKTSIFPDKKSKSYVLPLKADVRKKEGIQVGDTISFTLKVS